MTQAFTRDDMATAIAKHFDVPKQKGKEVVDIVFGEILNAIRGGRKVHIAQVGSFRPVTMPKRKGRNPSSGEVQEFPEKRAVRFKLSTKAGI